MDFHARPAWQSPGEAEEARTHAPDVSAEQEEGPQVKVENDPTTPPKHYPSRTCRICLEEVPPTLEPLIPGISGMLNPTPRVTYISSDPTSGRLIRPCKCRGSQKYVHEGCLQEWRHADPFYGRRNYWECPTCKFKYRLERMKWSRLITSTVTQIAITLMIMLTFIFLIGFVADPIINIYLDPYETLTSLPAAGAAVLCEDESTSWTMHFLKGLTSLGLLGFVKVFFAMSPWHWWNLRQTGLVGGGRRRRGGGRERLEDISLTVVIIGIVTFIAAVWTWVRAWTARTLQVASERVADVQGPDDDDDDDDTQPAAAQAAADTPDGASTSGFQAQT